MADSLVSALWSFSASVLMPRVLRCFPRSGLAALAAGLCALVAVGCSDQAVELELVAGGDGTPVEAAVQVADRLFVVPGGGGNTAVFLTKAGVVVVDPKYASSWEALATVIRGITDAPITHVIVTHSHGDHAEGVVHLPNATVIAQTHTLERMRYYQYLPSGPDARPRAQAFDTRVDLFEGPDAITVMNPGPAHTDGDAIVYFREARALHLGDVFPGQMFPSINLESGGDGRHYPSALRAILAAFPDADHIITGHAATLGRGDLVEFAEFMEFIVGYVAREMRMFRDKNTVFRALNLPARFTLVHRIRQFDTLDEIDRSIRPRWQRVF